MSDDDKSDLLDVPERPEKLSWARSGLQSPEVRAKRDKAHSEAIKLPDEVSPPEGVEDPNDVDSWWPYYDPDRDGRNYGRPRMIKTPEEFDALVDDYFRKLKARKQRPTITGLCLHLGFTSQQSLVDYSKRYGGRFADSIRRARTLVRLAYEHNLVRKQGSVQGVMFALRSFGRYDEDGPEFQDTRRTELTGKDGQPIAMAHLTASLEGMSDVEKATRLYHILREAVGEGRTIEHDDTEDEDDEE